eukprot:1020628-Pelagomonas_calceolata.AAC.7
MRSAGVAHQCGASVWYISVEFASVIPCVSAECGASMRSAGVAPRKCGAPVGCVRFLPVRCVNMVCAAPVWSARNSEQRGMSIYCGCGTTAGQPENNDCRGCGKVQESENDILENLKG